MALDQAMLDSVDASPDQAMFRTYGWTPPTLSLGYFQSIRQIPDDRRWSRVPVVRRPSGGGALWHEHEITYALVVPRTDPRARRPAELYRAVHAVFVSLLLEDGLHARRRGSASGGQEEVCSRAIQRPFLCFHDHDPEDVVVGDRKVLGSAQRRRPNAVLQHGSLLLSAAAAVPDVAGLGLEPPALAESRTRWRSRLREAIPRGLGFVPVPAALTNDLSLLAAELSRSVYVSRSWIERR
jgi:lipoate-protein ligase A